MLSLPLWLRMSFLTSPGKREWLLNNFPVTGRSTSLWIRRAAGGLFKQITPLDKYIPLEKEGSLTAYYCDRLGHLYQVLPATAAQAADLQHIMDVVGREGHFIVNDQAYYSLDQ